MASKTEQLDKLNGFMSECSKCALRAGCTRVVPGEGSAEAEIMFIGEGPGKKEDELGRPFVGAAGKFLDEMLAIIKLKREQVYIANVVKCRPPGNRDPLPEEVAECWPWLVEQIKIIDPKLIVTLGRHSMERFLPNQKISEVHGKAMRREIPEIGKRVFYTLYHPAAALYNGSMREVLIKDFRRILRVLEKIKKESL
ncbi:MAG: uracil-DNA glycosylase [Candidatus Moranbacteria bacterium CG_4_9_14_3_um_filter_42_9]|nr:MAG: uracil-DNA glycosylase [Candidatus Moranbacteria bacterium CG_4_9_14_3_um_filter_42_9]